MDYKNWEQKIKQKLEDASPEDLGYSTSAKEMWEQISKSNKPPKRTLFLFQPVASHIAATFLGILISTVAYFLFLHNPKPQKTVALTKDAQKKLPIILHEAKNKTREQKQEHAEEKRKTAVKNINPNHSDNIAATQHHLLSQKTSQTAIKLEITKDTVVEYVNAIRHSEQQQIIVQTTPKVMHWSDIEDHYKNQSEPKYWTKLVRRIDKRLEKDEQSHNNKAPVIVWIETFK